jgi:hypothetical protein
MLNILILRLMFYQLNLNGCSLFFFIFCLFSNFQMISLLHLVHTKLYRFILVAQIYFKFIGSIFFLRDKLELIEGLCFKGGSHLDFLERSLLVSQKLSLLVIFLRLKILDFLDHQYHHLQQRLQQKFYELHMNFDYFFLILNRLNFLC